MAVASRDAGRGDGGGMEAPKPKGDEADDFSHRWACLNAADPRTPFRRAMTGFQVIQEPTPLWSENTYAH
jgi:hypothetical protein